MPKIVQKDAAVLRQVAADVPIEEIASERIRGIIKSMKKALASQDDGVAIAAPQIGEPLRIFVVSGKVIELIKSTEGKDETHEDQVYINPTITKASKERQMVEEGCLSVRWLYGKVSRARKATVEAYDENGKRVVKGGSGLMAQIFQHEIDHLNGVLFTDKAVDVVDIPPEEQERLHEAGAK